MKNNLILIIAMLYVLPLSSMAQQIDLRILLNKIDNAVSALKEGQYNIHNVSSREAIADSLRQDNVNHSYFSQLSTDKLLGYQISSNAKSGYYQEIYDGEHLYTLVQKTLEITDKESHPEKITRFKTGFTFYPLFKAINNLLQPFNTDANFSKLKISAPQLYKGELCYQLTQIDDGNIDTVKKTDISWYISVKSNIPIGQLVKLRSVIGQVKQTLLLENWISELSTAPVPPNQFSKEKLGPYNKEKQYDPADKPNKDVLLPVGSIAPDWELPLIAGKKLKLSDLKGKIVIMDFWFKACAPCQAQMISLQKLHDKYDKQKVMFIGVNTIDDFTKDQLSLFLEKRNITMASVYNGKTIQKQYNAPYSPALFIIDKDGKIVYALDGESDTLIADLTTVIDKNL